MSFTIQSLKRLFAFVTSALSLLTLQCCEKGLEECFFLEGDQTLRSYDLNYFNQIESHLPGEYTIKQANFNRLEVAGHQRYIDSLSTHVINDKVYLNTNSPLCQEYTDFGVTIYMKDLKALYVDEKSTIVIENFEHQKDLSISLTKESFLEIKRFKGLRNFYAELSREAKISTTAKLDTLEQIKINIEGNGSFKGFLVPTKKVNINIEGKGYCEVYATEKLNVVIKGEANVYSKGMPSLYKRITGKGNVYFKN